MLSQRDHRLAVARRDIAETQAARDAERQRLAASEARRQRRQAAAQQRLAAERAEAEAAADRRAARLRLEATVTAWAYQPPEMRQWGKNHPPG